ncbi:MAG: response regulator [Oligoflexales bacterium]
METVIERTKILIVDDRRENILALRSLIEASDIEFLEATSGVEALDLLLEHEIALALVDVEMPDMDGIELAKLMRASQRTKSIPIIFVTASSRWAAGKFEGYESGAIAFLIKPLDTYLVRNKVRVFVELDQKSKALKRQKELLQEKLLENEALRRSAEEASNAKSRFLANVSHEIRTPLGAVLGFAELLKDEGQSREDILQCIEAIERNGNLLSKLIDDVIDLAKIEADKIDVEKIDVSLGEMIKDLSLTHSLKASEKGINFKVELETLVPQILKTDPVRLRQCLNNIVGNAIKFTSAGSVTLRVRSENTPGKCMIKFTVEDTGCGLSEEEISRLFQPFSQANSSTTRMYGGSGLGLILSRRLARLLGGDLVLEQSQPDSGSVFSLLIDAGTGECGNLVGERALFDEDLSHDGPETQRKLDGVRVLVVDDASDNREYIKRLLSAVGAEVDVADNGKDALSRAKSEDFDVIVMDLQMPVMDGYQASQALRIQGFGRGIIALTANATKEQIKRAKASGCDECLTKPIKRRTIIEAIDGLLPPGRD